MLSKTPKPPAAQVEFAKKAAAVKATSSAADSPPPHVALSANVAEIRAYATARGWPRLLSKAEVLAITGYSFPTLWELMRADPPKFPRARSIGGSKNGGRAVWLSDEIEAWMRDLPTVPYKPKPKDDPEEGEAA
ncbi:MAG: AlpA family phage regulatory protein [Xanthobacteraceae bacterium]